MPIKTVEIKGIRNLKKAVLQDCATVNLLSGMNGSGKTSVLEAIFLLGMGRSFRATKLDTLINEDMTGFAVRGILANINGTVSTIGVSKDRGEPQRLRVNRESIKAVAGLARELPLILINHETLTLVDGGPKPRRQYVDWGAFHVKPDFISVWRKAQRGLRQRNSLIRRHNGASAGLAAPWPPDIEAWEQELSREAGLIDDMRRQYICSVVPFVYKFLSSFGSLPEIEIKYQRGWPEGAILADCLKSSRDKDGRLGHTHLGPHRATLEILAQGGPATDVLSRGQQKLVSAALKLAQGEHIIKTMGIAKSPVFLVDDLPAELDSQHRREFCRLLEEIGCQAFITSTDADLIGAHWQRPDEVRLFHVEHGNLNG